MGFEIGQVSNGVAVKFVGLDHQYNSALSPEASRLSEQSRHKSTKVGHPVLHLLRKIDIIPTISSRGTTTQRKIGQSSLNFSKKSLDFLTKAYSSHTR
jgi:hypothetical protein